MAKNEEAVKNDMFGFGDKNVAFAKYFIGTSYLNGLVSPDDNIDINISNVNFEPGCRNDWHIHHDGFQILLVTATKKRASPLNCLSLVTWLRSTKALSTGMALLRIPGSPTLRLPKGLVNGWKRLMTTTMINWRIREY